MSRSYKKHPFISNTAAGVHRGEKDDKQICNRNIRHTNKILEKEITKDVDTSDEKNFAVKNELGHSTTWMFRKDGKSLVGPDCIDTSIHWTKDGKMRK